jgi:hypothetical protein
MSALIGSVKGPHHNSPADAAEVWCNEHDVELNLFSGSNLEPRDGVQRRFDPIAARNLAALLVRASEEVERMRARTQAEPG